MITPEKEEALTSAGFRFSSKAGGWDGHGVLIEVEHIRSLELWELDQIIAGVRRGVYLVELGDDIFEFVYGE